MTLPSELKAFLDGQTDVLVRDGIEYFVIEPRTMEWAAAVRLRLKTRPVSAVAVTLPETLRALVPQVLSTFPDMGVLVFSPSDDSSSTAYDVLWPAESVDARWEALRTAAEMRLAWRMVAIDTKTGETLEPPEIDGTWLSHVPYPQMMRTLVRQHRVANALDVNENAAHVAAFHLAELKQFASSPVVFVCTPEWVVPVMHALENPLKATVFRPVSSKNIHAFCANDELTAIACAEPPGFVKQYEAWRVFNPDAPPALPNRYTMTLHLLEQAIDMYNQEFSTQLPIALLTTMLRYMRNLALTQNRLFPTRYDLVIATRSFYDQHFGWFFYQCLTGPISTNKQLPLFEVGIDALGLSVRKIQFAFKFRQYIPRFLTVFQSRPKETRPGEWKKDFDAACICSYPPEDIFIEGSVRHLKHKGQAIIGERTHRSEPFTSTLFDGLDMRETLRHWYEHRIWVREEISSKSKVGSVVIIFDEDLSPSHEKYPYCAHWHGEHQQESDMAFYATNPEDHVVGPGICRCEYGGLVMTSPPGRMWPVWEDPQLRQLGRKSEILLATGLQLTQEPVVLYIAPQPPRAYLKHLALRMGLRVLYLPLGALSPDRMRKLRTFHILSGHHVRQWAHRFLLDS